MQVHGFVLWVLSALAWVLFIAWAYTPDRVLAEGLGVTYFPAKHWALALPCHGFVTVLAVAVGYSSLNLLVAPAPDSAVAIGHAAADAHARRAPDARDAAARAHDAPAGARLSAGLSGAAPPADDEGGGAAPGGAAGSGEVPDIGDMDIVEVSRILFGKGGQFDRELDHAR